MKSYITVLFFFISLIVSSQTIIGDLNKNISVSIGKPLIDFTTYTIYSDAVADLGARNFVSSEAQLMLQSQAEEETIKLIYQELCNVLFNGDETVYDFLSENIYLQAYSLDESKKSRLVSISYPTRTSIKVVMALDLIGDMENNIIQKYINEAASYEPLPVVTYFEVGKSYDSLVIDARNIGFNPSLFPTIYDIDGNMIHNISFVSKSTNNTMGKHGFVRYTKDTKNINEVYDDLGDNPFHVVAWNPRGRLAGDLVIGNEDASIVLSTPKLKQAIRDSKVVIIID